MRHILFSTFLCFALSNIITAADFKFVVYSDVQGGGEGNHAKLPGIISRIPGNVVCAATCGDLAGLGNSTVATDTTWNFFLSTALNLGVPFWPTRGNHDGVEDAEGVTLGHWKNTMNFIRDRAEYMSGSPDNDYYSYMYNNCLFVVLNNMNGTKAPETAWIASEVATDRAKNATHIFVFLHYAMLVPNQPDSVQLNYRWEKYISPYFENMPNLAGVFWGDRHWFWKGDYKGITGVLVPPCTSPRATEASPGPGELAGSFSGYLVVHVKGDSVTAKAYNFSEIEQASFVVKGYDPLGKLPILSVSAFIENSSIEKFLSSRVGAVITYQDTFNGNALIYDTTHSLNFLSLSPEIASVDTFGNVVGVNEGSAEIVVSRRSVADTITVTVLPATLVPDSVVISRDTVKLLANDTVSIKATGYFHDSNGAFTRSITNDVIWFSANTSVATVTDGLVTGIVAGGPVNIIASLSGVADTCFFTILPRPDYLKRINFKTDTIPHAVGWRADDGRVYSAAKAMGWLTSTSTTTRGDRDSGILLGTIVSKSTETEFKIDAPDGEYILKIGVGDNKYGGLCTVTHGGELIVNHSAVANAIVVDTITVTNNTGIVLGIYGKICYIVAISSQDIPIDMVADDGNLRLISPVPPSTGAEEFSETAGSTLRVYPNPFNPVVNIQFPFIKTSRTNKLAIFDMRGRLVHSATFNSNVRTFAWNASDKESGLYIVKVSNGTREFSSGIVLMK